jgi:hypothetical protein
VLTLVVLAGQSHQLYAFPVSRKCEGHSVIGVVGAHKLCGQSNDLVHVRCAGVADLSAANLNALAGLAVNTDTVNISCDNVEELIRVRLHMSSLILGISGTLNVSLSAVADKVIFLAICDILQQTLMVLGAAGLIAVICDRIQCVQSIRAHAALHAAANAMADKASHELLLQQIILGMVNVGAAVYLFTLHAGDVGFRYADVSIARIVSRVIALLHNVSTAYDPVGQVTLGALLAVGTVNLLAVQIHVGLHVQKPFLILFVCSYSHFLIPPY